MNCQTSTDDDCQHVPDIESSESEEERGESETESSESEEKQDESSKDSDNHYYDEEVSSDSTESIESEEENCCTGHCLADDGCFCAIIVKGAGEMICNKDHKHAEHDCPNQQDNLCGKRLWRQCRRDRNNLRQRKRIISANRKEACEKWVKEQQAFFSTMPDTSAWCTDLCRSDKECNCPRPVNK